MLTGKHVVFLGGDARQLEVIKHCILKQAQVSLIGFDNLHPPFSGTIKRELSPEILHRADYLILPIVGAGEDGQISSPFTSQALYLTQSEIQALPEHCIVFTGIARPYLKNLCADNQIRCVELMSRDDVAIYNSIPTVEGALMMGIQNTDFTIHNSEILVLGLGRVGMTLARTLKALGAKVRVGISKKSDEARSFEMGLQPIDLDQLAEQVEQIELIFNTIPARILTPSVLTRIPHNTVIIDLASKPGGVDYDYAKKRGIQAILAPSLPGIVAPRTAGKILADTIYQVMMEEQQTKEGD